MTHLPAGLSGPHLLVVHIPIVLLSIAPLLVLVGIGLSARKRRFFLGSALAVMTLGTAMTFVAVATGVAAMNEVGSAPRIKAIAEEHRALAEITTELFSLLTVGFAALVFAPGLLRRELESRTATALLAVYLTFYATGAVLLFHTALHGGRLAHEIAIKTAVACQLPGKGSAK